MRVLPYRTADNVIDGVVMTFADITAIKQLEESLGEQQAELQAARDYAENIIATIREPLVVLDGELRIVSASRSFYETFQVTPAETEGRLLYEIGQRQWDIPALRQLLEDILPKNTQFEDFRVEHDFPDHRAQGALAQCPANRTGSRTRASDPAGDGGHHGSVGSAKTNRGCSHEREGKRGFETVPSGRSSP